MDDIFPNDGTSLRMGGIFFNLERKEELTCSGKMGMVAIYLLYSLWFPFDNLWSAIQGVRGKLPIVRGKCIFFLFYRTTGKM